MRGPDAPRRTTRSSVRTIAVGIALLMLAVPATGLADEADEADGARTTASPPYEDGADNGEDWSVRYADGDSGRIAILSHYLLPVPLHCQARSEIATLRAVLEPERAVTGDSVVDVAVEQALLDAFGFVTVLVLDEDGAWYGSGHLRGPAAAGTRVTVDDVERLLAGDDESAELVAATVEVRLEGAPGLPVDEQPALHVLFGLEVASGCPAAGGATASFPEIGLTY